MIHLRHGIPIEILRTINARDLSEDEHQILLFDWAGKRIGEYSELAYLFHVPNGGLRSKQTASRLKKMGVKPGVPDVFLDVPRRKFHGLRIELKRPGETTSAIQKNWVQFYRDQGYWSAVCAGWESARDEILWYLE